MSPHPDPGDLAAYVEGRLPLTERNRLETHLADCSECRTVVTDVSLHLRADARRRKWVVAAPAAAVAAAVVLFLVVPSDQSGPAPRATRDAAEPVPESIQSVAALEPASGAAVRVDSLRFVWASVGTSTLYRLALTDSAGGAVWASTTSDTATQLPPDVLLTPGRRYFWYVDALMPDGSEASTGVTEFRTRGP